MVRWKPLVFQVDGQSNIVLQVAEMWRHLEGAVGRRVYGESQGSSSCRIQITGVGKYLDGTSCHKIMQNFSCAFL